jgi:hydrogenase maturation protein HypF
MQTWHIHISGLVQGVGFRPHVYRLAQEMNIKGTVCNSTNGVHINASAEESTLYSFLQSILDHPPLNAVISNHETVIIEPKQYPDFLIIESEEHPSPQLLLTPDFGLCAQCREELFDKSNRRYHYPFITCTHCGPRYSITNSLPYDRPNTTMSVYEQCWQCKKEYHNPLHRRYYSQTNSCDDCGITMHLYNKEGENICNDADCILIMVKDALLNGHIVAVKGIGGYMLMCDATNFLTIKTLRERKQRPAKPFAVLYPSLKSAEADVHLSIKEKEALQSMAAPIVLCTMKDQLPSGLNKEMIAPSLNKLGVMLPYSPLLALIADAVHKPMVATSGNISGSPIIYKDDQALEYLGEIADFVLTYDREIVVPQDDSVMQFSPKHQQPVLLRRSRGLAPNYFPVPFQSTYKILAAGAELKGSFALMSNQYCYISQYLGDQGTYDAQQSYKHTLQHISSLLKFDADVVIADKHPAYHVTDFAKNYAAEEALPMIEVQHHEAHFTAVLAENKQLETDDPVLGVVWDGTGYGSDENIWGGEFFMLRNHEITRQAHLDYFPVLMGDKMSREPRLSILSLCGFKAEYRDLLTDKFTQAESAHYKNMLLYQKSELFTSSMGRLLDAAASLLGVCDVMSYEGEAAMKLEVLALQCKEPRNEWYDFKVFKNIVYWNPLLEQLTEALKKGVAKEQIAYSLHLSLAKLVKQMVLLTDVRKIAFSGGVFQNTLLVDLLHTELGDEYVLFFHQQLSPNDECIAFGQMAHVQLQLKKKELIRNEKQVLIS